MVIINSYEEKFEQHKNKIIENIDYGKSVGINKISAILASSENDKESTEKDLITWLIMEGYKVSLVKDEMKVLIIEWE